MYTEEIYAIMQRCFNEVHPKYPFPTAEEFAGAPEKFRAALGYFATKLNEAIRQSNLEWIKTTKDMYIVELKHQNKVIRMWRNMAFCLTLFSISCIACLVLVAKGILVV